MICQKVHIYHNRFMISSQNGQAGEKTSRRNNGNVQKLQKWRKISKNYKSSVICKNYRSACSHSFFSPQVKAICYGCPQSKLISLFCKKTNKHPYLQVKAICYGCPPVFLSSDGSGVEENVLAVSSESMTFINCSSPFSKRK